VRYIDEYPLHELTSIGLVFKREHGNAFVFFTGRVTARGRNEVCFIPKSQCDYDHASGVCTLPKWLAKRKGLI
jgi:hypothetical protein